MKIFGFESSAKAVSVALYADGKFAAQYWQNSALTHSRTLLKMAEDMLENLDLKMRDVDVFAVARGPGSFTGVRIGVAAVKGLAWAAEKPVCGVSTLEAMAYHLAGCCGVVCPVMDARRSQVYNAKFVFSNGALTRICEDRALSVEELVKEAEKDGKEYFLVGDGALMCYHAFLKANVKVQLAPEPLLLQSAWGVCRAAQFGRLDSPDDLTPNYLRLSQAERERLEKENQKKNILN